MKQSHKFYSLLIICLFARESLVSSENRTLNLFTQHEISAQPVFRPQMTTLHNYQTICILVTIGLLLAAGTSITTNAVAHCGTLHTLVTIHHL